MIRYEASPAADGNGWYVLAQSAGNMPLEAVFTGWCADKRARAYATWMNGEWPVSAPTELNIVDTKGRQLKLVLSGIEWTSDQKRGTVTARTKDNIIPIGEVQTTTVIGEKVLASSQIEPTKGEVNNDR